MREIALKVRVTGRVQGVAYRAWTRGMARRLGLHGWVANEQSGAVRALIAGDETAVEAMVTAMREGPGAARVTDVWTEPADPAEVPAGFEIVRQAGPA